MLVKLQIRKTFFKIKKKLIKIPILTFITKADNKRLSMSIPKFLLKCTTQNTY